MPISATIAKTAGEAVKSIMGGLDELITSKEEKLAIEAKMQEVIQNGMNTAVTLQAEIILAEAKGSWLQRNWRPIMALSFGFIVVATYFIFPVINLWLHNPDLKELISELKDNEGFWKLLTLMITGYAVGRTVEKVFGSEDKDENKNKVKGIFKRKRREE